MNQRIIANYKNPRHPTSFGGINKLSRHYKIPEKRARTILSGIRSYTLHREGKKPRERNPFFVYRLRQQIQIDLIEVHKVARSNNGVKYLLTAIDVFSKFLVVIPMKRKTAEESLKAIKLMVAAFRPKPIEIMSDAGREFVNAQVKRYFQGENIEHFTPASDMKCPIVERVNRTIQNRIYQFLTENTTDRYIDALPNLVFGYNNTEHTSTGLKPIDAEKERNHLFVRDALNRHYFSIKGKKPQFKVGDYVRLKMVGKFHRSYNEQQTRELWEIVEVDVEMPVPRYYVKSLETLERLQGAFYSNELTLVSMDKFPIERVLRRRRYRGVNQVFVKWEGFNDEYNSWIPADAIGNVD